MNDISGSDGAYAQGVADAPKKKNHQSQWNHRNYQPAPVEVWVATLDTGGISHGGREFMAVDYSEENARAALFRAIKAAGLPRNYDGQVLKTRAAIEDYFAVRVNGPIAIGSGTQVEAL